MKIALFSADRTSSDGYAINLGDAFLTDALESALRDSGHDVTVLDFGACDRTDGGTPRRRLGGLADMLAVIRRSDAVVVGGGTLFQDDSRLGWGGLPRMLVTISAVGWLTRTPVAFFAVGVDPVSRFTPALILRLAAWRRPVWVRDADSQRRALSLLHVQARLAADACLLSRAPDVMARESAGSLVVALNRDEVAELSEDAAVALTRDWKTVTFLSMVQGAEAGDAAVADDPVLAVFESVTDRLHWSEAMRVVAGADIVIASRMHAMYMAALTGVPVAAVGDKAKVRTFVAEFGIGHTASIAGAAYHATPADRSAVAAARDRVDEALDDLVRVLTTRNDRASAEG